MTNPLFISPFLPALNLDGSIEGLAKIAVYTTGTLSLATIYDAAGVAITNPVVADINGRFADIYFGTATAYRVRLLDAANNVLEDVDPYPNPNNVLTSLAASGGAALVGYSPGGSVSYPSTATTVQAKLRESVSVKDFGAVGDGATNDAAAFTSALGYVSGLSAGGIVHVPHGKYYLATGITVPNNVELRGEGVIFQIPMKGTVLEFANAVSACITLTTGSNGSANVSFLGVTRQGTAGTGTIGIKCDQGSNIVLTSVFVDNHGRNYWFRARSTSGISALLDHCWSSRAVQDHIYNDSWPELRINGGRYGINGASNNYACNSYIHIQGLDTSLSGGIGPNTIIATNVLFNQGSNAPAYGMWFEDCGTPLGNTVVFIMTAAYWENIATAFIKSNIGTEYIQRVFIGAGTIVNATGAAFFALDATTSIGQFEINGAKIYTNTFDYNFGDNIGFFTIIGSEISTGGGAATITGHALNESAFVSYGTAWTGSLVIDGKFNYLDVITPSLISSTATELNATSLIRTKSFSAEIYNKPIYWSPGIGTTLTPAVNGQLTLEATSNTSVKVKLKGSDGIVRSGTITLS